MSDNSYFGDQPAATSIVTGGTDPQMSASAGAAIATLNANVPIYLFKADHSFVWSDRVFSSRRGVPYQLDASWLAALQAQSAPIVAA